MTDMWAGIFDGLKSYGSSNSSETKAFFDSGYAGTEADGSKILSKEGERRVMEAGWDTSAAKGTQLNQLANAAATAPLVKPAEASQVKMNDGQMDLRNEQLKIEAPAKTAAISSTDPHQFERQWLLRLTDFARLEDKVQATKGGK